MSSHSLKIEQADALMTITARPELIMKRGEGSWLWDHRHKRYLDFIQGWAVNCLGHSPAAMIEALTKQAQSLINPSPAYYNEPMILLAEKLVQHSCFDKVFFCNSGAEANEGAIKLARKWGKKYKNPAGAHRFEIITFENGFHGRTLATMSASGKPGWDTLFAPQVPGFPKATLNDIASVEKLLGLSTVAIMLEPIQGEAGVVPATPEFMRQLRALADQHQLLLICDEVQTGCGRTGKLFAYEWSEIVPDIMTLGKGLGGGVPLAGLLCRAECAVFEAGDQGGTYNGNPLMTAVGLAVLEQLTSPGFLQTVQDNGLYLREQLLALSAQYGFVGERGQGLLRALLLSTEDGTRIVELARELEPEGLLLNAPRSNLLRFMPALNISQSEIDRMIELLKLVFTKVF